jgi:transcriptional regulator with XRE-family HTH domain
MPNYKESYESLYKRFSKNLSKALKEAGLSQRQQLLAGLDPRYIARLKKGDGNPTVMTIWRICKVIGIDPEVLFKK